MSPDTGTTALWLPPRDAFPKIPAKLTPVITIERDEFVLMVAALSPIAAADVESPVSSVADRRGDIVAALDYLFFGV
jgi:hypothetical protein